MAISTHSSEPLLRVEGIYKRYPGGLEAVKNLSLEIWPGEVFGLIGPNGAGKSTLLKLIAGLLRPEKGRVIVQGHDVTRSPTQAARWLGLMPDPLGVYTDISCREYLTFFAMAHGIQGERFTTQLKTTVELLGLGPWMEAEVETLSAGWQRRLALGRILLLDVPLLLLDEPAAGLDISARVELLEIIRRLAGLGKTVVISSHILPELEELADRFGIMKNGQWMDIVPDRAFFDRAELRQGLGGCRWRITCREPEKALAALTAAGASPAQVNGSIEFGAPTEEAAAALLQAAVNSGALIFDFRRLDSELTDVALRVLEGGPS